MDENRLALLLKTLYSSTDNDAIQAASKELNDWQQTAEAWKQADTLLSTAGLQGEFYYFFAQTLKTKIQYDMYQLSESNFLPLRDSLIQKILAVANSSAAKATRKQLCLAMADLTIQATDIWGSSIPDLVNLLSANHPLELIDILRLIPEETENMKLMTESEKRNKSRFKCIEYYYSVLELLNSMFTNSSISTPAIHDLIMDCFLAWLRFDAPPIQYSLADSPMVNHCLNQIGQVTRENFTIDDKCIEILSEVIRSTTDYRNGGSSQLVEQKIFPHVHALIQVLISTNIQQEIDDGSVDIDSVKSIARLIAFTAEGMMNHIIESPRGDSRISELLFVVIKIFNIHSIDVSETVVPFLEDYLNATCGNATEVHELLFESIVIRCNVMTESTFNKTDPFTSVDSDYYYFRNSDLLKLLYTISRDFFGRSEGLEKLVRGLISHADSAAAAASTESLQEAFASCVKDQLSGISDPTESVRSVVEYMIEKLPNWISIDTVHACTVMDAFRRRAMISIIGSCASWIRTSEQLLGLINLSAQILIRPSVIHPSIHVAAAVSIRELCMHSHCRSILITGPNGPSAIESITRLFTRTISHLPASDHSVLTEGIVSVISAQADDQLFVNLVRGVIMAPLIDSLNQCRLNADIANTSVVVDRMTAVIRSMNRLQRGSVRYNAIGELVVNSMWPSLAGSMEKFRSEYDLVEKACRLIKHSLRAVPDYFKQLILPLGQLLIRDFSQCQHSSYLYTAEVLGQEYASESEVRPALGELFDNLVTSGIRVLETKMHASFNTSIDSVDELIEDLFGLVERYLRFCPAIVVKSPAIAHVFRILVPAFGTMKRRESVDAVSAFVEQIYSGDWTHSLGSMEAVRNEDVMNVRRALGELAPALICQLFDLIVNVCGRSMRMAIPSILMVMNNFDPTAYKNDWITRGLSRVPVSILTDRDKQAAVNALCAKEDERAVTRCIEDILYRAELVGRRVRNEQK